MVNLMITPIVGYPACIIFLPCAAVTRCPDKRAFTKHLKTTRMKGILARLLILMNSIKSFKILKGSKDKANTVCLSIHMIIKAIGSRSKWANYIPLRLQSEPKVILETDLKHKVSRTGKISI